MGILNFSSTTTMAAAKNNANLPSQYQKSDGFVPTSHKSVFRKGIFCRYCHREGHSIDECYRLIGLPPGHPAQARGKNYGKNTQQKGNYNQYSRNGAGPKAMQVMQNCKPNEKAEGNPEGSQGNSAFNKGSSDRLDSLETQITQILNFLKGKEQPDDPLNNSHTAGIGATARTREVLKPKQSESCRDEYFNVKDQSSNHLEARHSPKWKEDLKSGGNGAAKTSTIVVEKLHDRVPLQQSHHDRGGPDHDRTPPLPSHHDRGAPDHDRGRRFRNFVFVSYFF